MLTVIKPDATLTQGPPCDAPNIISAKSADDCARISTLQYHQFTTIRRWKYFRSIPSNVITAPSDLNVTDGQTDRHCGITAR